MKTKKQRRNVHVKIVLISALWKEGVYIGDTVVTDCDKPTELVSTVLIQ